MDVSVSTVEAGFRPAKTPKLDEQAMAESKPSSTYGRLRVSETEKDEYIRQYVLFHCQYHRTKGFGIEWEKFDYHFNPCDPYDGAPPLYSTKTNEEAIKELTQLAISNHNQKNGSNIVFVEHVSANFRDYSYPMAHWITFWARDMSSPCPVSKLYQAKVLNCADRYQFPIFRVKPTDEEMLAVRVPTPVPVHHDDFDKPPVDFRRARPGDGDPVPGTPFVFTRDGYFDYDFEVDEDEDKDEDKDEWDWSDK